MSNVSASTSGNSSANTQQQQQAVEPSQQQQTPPPPKRLLFVYDGKEGAVREDPETIAKMSKYFSTYFEQELPPYVGFEMNQSGFSIVVPKEQPKFIPLEAIIQQIPQERRQGFAQAFQNIMTGSSEPLQLPQSPQDGNSGASQQQSDQASQQSQQQRQTGSSDSSQQQRSIQTGSTDSSQQQRSIQTGSTDSSQQQIEALRQQLQLMQQQQLLLQQQQQHPAPYPVYYPQPFAQQQAVLPQQRLPDDPYFRGIILPNLRGHTATLNRIKNQLNDPNLMNIHLLQIGLDGQNARTLPQLQENRNALIDIVFTFLENKTLPANLPQHLIAQVQARNGNLANPNQNAILAYLLTAVRPARPNIDNNLDDLLAVYSVIEQTLNQYLTTEIGAVGIALNPHLPDAERLDLTGQTNELQRNPCLTRLVAIDGEITTALRNKLNEKIQKLQTDTRSLHPPFAYNYNGIAAAVLPAPATDLTNHTRAELLQVPANIVTQFRAYLPGQINLMPQHLQPIVPAAPAPPAIDALDPLTPVVGEIINSLKGYLDGLPAEIKKIAARGDDSFASLNGQYQAIQRALGIELQGKIVAEQARLNPNQARQAAMLQKLNPPPPAAAATLVSLLAEVNAVGAQLLPPSDVERLVKIKAEFDKYIASYSWRKTANTIVGVTVAALLIYLLYHFSGEISSGANSAWTSVWDSVKPITNLLGRKKHCITLNNGEEVCATI